MPEQLISWLLRGRKRQTDAKGMGKKKKKKSRMERTKRSLAHCLVKPELPPRISYNAQQPFWFRGEAVISPYTTGPSTIILINLYNVSKFPIYNIPKLYLLKSLFNSKDSSPAKDVQGSQQGSSLPCSRVCCFNIWELHWKKLSWKNISTSYQQSEAKKCSI